MLPLPSPEEPPDSGPYDATRLFGAATEAVPAAETLDAPGGTAGTGSPGRQDLSAVGSPATRFKEPVYGPAPAPQRMPGGPTYAPLGPAYPSYQPYAPQAPDYPGVGIGEPVYGGARPGYGMGLPGRGVDPAMPTYPDPQGYPSTGQPPLFQPRPEVTPEDPIAVPRLGPADDAVFRPQGL